MKKQVKTARQRPRRDQPRRLEVAAAISILVFASASGRLLGPAPPLELGRAREQLEQWSRDRRQDMEELWSRLRRAGESDASRQPPAFAGTWRTAKSVDLDEFLDRALGVGYLKRTIAVKASQTQKLWKQGEVRAPGQDDGGHAHTFAAGDPPSARAASWAR